MRRSTSAAAQAMVLLLGLLALVACGPEYPPDPDRTQAKALDLSPEFAVKDSIAPMSGDQVDWRRLTVPDRSEVRIKYEVTPVAVAVGESPFSGEVSLYDDQGSVLDTKTLDSANLGVEVVFMAEGQRQYFVRFEAKEGTARYEIRMKVNRADPCALCLAEERCVDGKCVPPGECDPACEDGSFCLNGECVWSCPKGQEWRDGRCSEISKVCRPACKAGTRCRAGKCVAVAAKATGTAISGNILSSWPTGSGTTVLINRGSQDGVRKGAGGSIEGGGKITVKLVFPKQCQAFTSLPKSELGGRTKVSIRP